MFIYTEKLLEFN